MEERFKKDVKLAAYVALGFFVAYVAFPLVNGAGITENSLINALLHSYLAFGLMIAFAFWRDKPNASK